MKRFELAPDLVKYLYIKDFQELICMCSDLQLIYVTLLNCDM